MKLVDAKTGLEIKVGDEVTTFRGEKSILIGMRPPHKPSSTGRVYLKDDGEYYPGVIGAEWRAE